MCEVVLQLCFSRRCFRPGNTSSCLEFPSIGIHHHIVCWARLASNVMRIMFNRGVHQISPTIIQISNLVICCYCFCFTTTAAIPHHKDSRSYWNRRGALFYPSLTKGELELFPLRLAINGNCTESSMLPGGSTLALKKNTPCLP